MLVQRLRRWPSIKPASAHQVVFDGMWPADFIRGVNKLDNAGSVLGVAKERLTLGGPEHD